MVYVPLIGTSSPQGVMEIYGLVLPPSAAPAAPRGTADESTVSNSSSTAVGPTEVKSYQRSAVALRAMINAKDYK